jgi:hypothetical protein
MLCMQNRRLWQVSSIAFSIRLLFGASLAGASSTQAQTVADRPAFSRTLWGMTSVEAADTTLGRRLVTAFGRGLQASADPACLSAKGFTADAYEALGRAMMLRVSAAREAANATGLDAKAADAVYVAAMGPDRLQRLAALEAGPDTASKEFQQAWTNRLVILRIMDEADAVYSAFAAVQFQKSGAYSAAVFDGRDGHALRMDGDTRYERALGALPPQTREAVVFYWRTSNDALTKATDIMKANRLSGRDLAALIREDLMRHCISW